MNSPRSPESCLRSCSQCGAPILLEDPRRDTCSGACREAKRRGGRARGVEQRRIQAKDARSLAGITERELRYWLRTHVPHNGERMWGRPQITFADLYWLAYIARSKEAGVSVQRAGRAIPRALRLLESWPHPLSQTTMIEVAGSLFLARGPYSIEAPPPVVIVDGPGLAALSLTLHKRRVKEARRRASSPPGWRLRKREQAAAQSSGEREPE